MAYKRVYEFPPIEWALSPTRRLLISAVIALSGLPSCASWEALLQFDMIFRCLSPLAACMASSNDMRASSQGEGFQGNSNWISLSPVSMVCVTFTQGQQQKVMELSWALLSND